MQVWDDKGIQKHCSSSHQKCHLQVWEHMELVLPTRDGEELPKRNSLSSHKVCVLLCQMHMARYLVSGNRNKIPQIQNKSWFKSNHVPALPWPIPTISLLSALALGRTRVCIRMPHLSLKEAYNPATKMFHIICNSPLYVEHLCGLFAI